MEYQKILRFNPIVFDRTMRATLALTVVLCLILESRGQGSDDVILPPLIRARLYVSSLQGSDDQDGLSPDTALTSLQKASDLAVQGTWIQVMDGEYR